MTSFARLGRIPTAGIAAIALISSICATPAHYFHNTVRKAAMSANSRIDHIFGRSQPLCFGRLLISVPAGATIVYGPAWAGAEITRFPGMAEHMVDHLDKEKAGIEEERELVMPWKKREMFSPASPVGRVEDGEGTSKIIVGISQGSFYKLTAFVAGNDDLFRLQIPDIVHATALGEETGKLHALIRQFRHRAEFDTPHENGLCVDGGFMQGDFTYERVTLGVRLQEFPDVHLSIDVTKKPAPVESDALQPRIESARRRAIDQGRGRSYERIKFLRQGARQVAGSPGYEALVRMPSAGGGAGSHRFAYIGQSKAQDGSSLMLDVQLDTGVKANARAAVSPGLSDEEAILLWDRFLSSIIARPTGSGRPPSASKNRSGS